MERPKTAEEYRREAERVRMLADATASEAIRRPLFDMARQYERLARGDGSTGGQEMRPATEPAEIGRAHV